MYGLRVPAFVISPFAKRDYVSHVVHDHTSVLRFIETKFNLGALTCRDANADNLLDCFDFRRAAFLEPPMLATPGLPATGLEVLTRDPATAHECGRGGRGRPRVGHAECAAQRLHATADGPARPRPLRRGAGADGGGTARIGS